MSPKKKTAAVRKKVTPATKKKSDRPAPIKATATVIPPAEPPKQALATVGPDARAVLAKAFKETMSAYGGKSSDWLNVVASMLVTQIHAAVTEIQKSPEYVALNERHHETQLAAHEATEALETAKRLARNEIAEKLVDFIFANSHKMADGTGMVLPDVRGSNALSLFSVCHNFVFPDSHPLQVAADAANQANMAAHAEFAEATARIRSLNEYAHILSRGDSSAFIRQLLLEQTPGVHDWVNRLVGSMLTQAKQ